MPRWRCGIDDQAAHPLSESCRAGVASVLGVTGRSQTRGGAAGTPSIGAVNGDSSARLTAPREFSAVRDITILFSVDPRSRLGWVTTSGRGRFGLPDVELRAVSESLAGVLPAVASVMNSLAQFLVESDAGTLLRTVDDVSLLHVGADVEFGVGLVNRARGGVNADGADDSRRVRVGLRWTGVGRGSLPPMILVVAPDGEQNATEWLEKTCRTLEEPLSE